MNPECDNAGYIDDEYPYTRCQECEGGWIVEQFSPEPPTGVTWKQWLDSLSANGDKAETYSKAEPNRIAVDDLDHFAGTLRSLLETESEAYEDTLSAFQQGAESMGITLHEYLLFLDRHHHDTTRDKPAITPALVYDFFPDSSPKEVAVICGLTHFAYISLVRRLLKEYGELWRSLHFTDLGDAASVEAANKTRKRLAKNLREAHHLMECRAKRAHIGKTIGASRVF